MKKPYNRFKESVNLKQTKSIFKDMQKVYSGANKSQLINYIKKQNNIFSSEKSIDKVDVKHFIISPISPDLYSKLSTGQKDELERISREWIEQNFAKYGYIGAVEYNKDKSSKDYKDFKNVKEGFHIHAAVSSKYVVRGKADLLSLRESVTRHLAQNLDNDIRAKLGIKNKKEMESQRIKNITKKKQYQAVQQMKLSPEYLKNNQVLQSLNKDLSEVFESMGIKYTKKDELSSLDKRERYSILSKQIELKHEVKGLRKSVKFRDVEMEYVDKHIITHKEHITEAERVFQGELKSLQNFYKDETIGFEYYTAGEHRIFKKIVKGRLEEGSITQEQFLAQVANNKSYWKWINSEERAKQQKYLRYQQREFKKKIAGISQNIREYQHDRQSIQSLKKLDFNKIEKNMKQYGKLSNSLDSHYKVFNQRIDVICMEIDRLNIKSIKIKKLKLERIKKKKEMISQIFELDSSVSSKGMNKLIDSTKTKHDISITTGAYKSSSIDSRDKTIHAKSKKGSVQFEHILKGIARITKIPDLKLIKNMKTKKLFNLVKRSIYNKYPSFKQKLEQATSLEEFIKLFEKLEKKYKSEQMKANSDYSPQLSM